MNTVFKKIIAGLGITLSLGLVACQKESLELPDLPAPISTEVANGVNDVIKAAEKYTLHSWGITNLWYVGGKLDHLGNGGISYHYGSFRGDPQVSCEWEQTAHSTYLLDRTTGRCYESTYKKYAYPYLSPADTLLKTWRYSYNTEGRLLKRWNKNSVNESVNYTYDAAGDLKTIKFYDATGASIKELSLSYTPPPGESIHKNLYPMNLEVAELPDRYLRIFGRPSEHLVTQIIQMPSAGSTVDSYWHSYVYSFNTDGYVTEESKYRMGASSKYDYIKYDRFIYTENKGDQ